MEAEHHHSISEIGEKVLRQHLEAGNPGRKFRLGAFYLGNWITDWSQGIDPQLYVTIADVATPPDVDSLFKKFLFDAPSWIRGPIENSDVVTKLRTAIKKVRDEVIGQIHVIVGAGKSGKLAKAVKDALRWKAYFEFVYPKKAGDPPQMDPASFFHCYDRLFQQYLPHLHLDRPEITKGIYEAEPAKGPRNEHTAPPEMSQGDLYDYLREAVEITAGKIAYLDGGVPDGEPRLSWAAATFHPSRRHFTDETGKTCVVDDADPSWNYHLALLGQALHAVEDFFAHSTFAEHASIAIPNEVQRFQRWEEQDILARRLKRWQPGLNEKEWQNLPNDPHIVTGFFGTSDGIISLLHKLEKALGLSRDKLGKTVDDYREFDYQKLLNDILELKSDPSGAFKDDGNQATKWLKDKFNESIFGDLEKLRDGDEEFNRYADFFIDNGLPADIDPRIKQALKTATDLLGRGKAGASVYKNMKELVAFIEAPVAILKKFIIDKIRDQLVDLLEAYLIDAIETRLGSRNIGSHSLIAKDSGPEIFFKPAMQCAQAVHWYIVRTLARHGRRREVKVCRTAEGLSHANNLYCSQWVDWLELLEYFLCNPLAKLQVAQRERRVVASIIHVTEPFNYSKMSRDTLANLEERYRPTAFELDPVSGEPTPMGEKFTWQIIADANFPTRGLTEEQRKRQINKVLSHQPKNAMIVRDGINYAFRPGVPLVIPFQRVMIPEMRSEIAQRRWWYPIMIAKGEEAWQQLPNWTGDGCLPQSSQRDRHQPIPVSHAEVLQLVRRAEEMHGKREAAYNSAKSPSYLQEKAL